MPAGKVHIGISGWTYAPWRGTFYPAKLPHKKELAYAAGLFPSIEVNGTFYGLQRPEAFGQWRSETPDDFIFAVKGSRYITHMRKLRDIEMPLANFMASGILRLGPKLGPILWQFPPQLKFDAERFRSFFALLPRDTRQAIDLARCHDGRLDDRDWLQSDVEQPVRHAVEIRHDSFRTPEFIELLREYNIALVCADTVAWPRLMDLTSDFVYCRLHGSEELYVSGYDSAALHRWAARVQAWASGEEPAHAERVLPPTEPKHGYDVFVYFDNDVKVRAPADALSLAQFLKAGSQVHTPMSTFVEAAK